MDNIIFKQLKTEDSAHFEQGVRLLNVTQGEDLFAPNYLHERTSDPNSFVIAALEGNEIVSLAIAQVINNFDYYLPFVPNINEELAGKIVGSFSTLCTVDRLRGKGIGKKLSQKRLEWLKNKNCDVIVGVSWVSGLSHTSDRVFEKMGFKPIKRVDDFYLKSSTEHPFKCPGCKTQPCTCSAVLYKLDL